MRHRRFCNEENIFQKSFANYLCLHRVAPKTKKSYLQAVAGLSAFHQKPAEILDNDQIQDYLLHCIQEKQLAWASCNVLFCGLKKYYRDFLGRDESQFSIPPRPRARKLPILLSQEEVFRLLQVRTDIKHRALLTTIYGSGLRVSEAVNLRPEYIESKRMMIRDLTMMEANRDSLDLPADWSARLQKAWEKKWIVYAKKPFAGPKQVLDYLGHYTHRIAISNHRIKATDNDRITFTYKDRSNDNRTKTMELSAMEFIRRFLLHVLPKRFMKIRYYGFLANVNKKKAVLLIRRLIGKFMEVVLLWQGKKKGKDAPFDRTRYPLLPPLR